MKNITKKILMPVLLFVMISAQIIPAFAANKVFPVALQIKGFEDREVVNFSFSSDNQTDDTESEYLPMTRVVIRVKQLKDGNNQLQQWMQSSDINDAKIVFYNVAEGKVIKTIEMVNARCVSYDKNSSTTELNYEEIEIVCSVFRINNVRNNNLLNFGTTISNDGKINQIIIICVSVAAIAAIAGGIVIVAKKKKNN